MRILAVEYILAAFLGDSSFIMVHAETVTDNSGFLDYSYLDSTSLNGISFYKRVRCAEIWDEFIEEEHDIRFLNENGFDPKHVD